MAEWTISFLCCHPKGMNLKYIMNIMLHVSIVGGAGDYLTLINKDAMFQYFGGPHP